MAEKKTKKDKLITIRATEVERAEWAAKAAKMDLTLADYFRYLAGKTPTNIRPAKPIKRRKFTPADPELLRQIGWIGNNLNQIAKAANQGNTAGILEQLIEIDRQVRRIADAF